MSATSFDKNSDSSSAKSSSPPPLGLSDVEIAAMSDDDWNAYMCKLAGVPPATPNPYKHIATPHPKTGRTSFATPFSASQHTVDTGGVVAAVLSTVGRRRDAGQPLPKIVIVSKEVADACSTTKKNLFEASRMVSAEETFFEPVPNFYRPPSTPSVFEGFEKSSHKLSGENEEGIIAQEPAALLKAKTATPEPIKSCLKKKTKNKVSAAASSKKKKTMKKSYNNPITSPLRAASASRRRSPRLQSQGNIKKTIVLSPLTSNKQSPLPSTTTTMTIQTRSSSAKKQIKFDDVVVHHDQEDNKENC